MSPLELLSKVFLLVTALAAVSYGIPYLEGAYLAHKAKNAPPKRVKRFENLKKKKRKLPRSA